MEPNDISVLVIDHAQEKGSNSERTLTGAIDAFRAAGYRVKVSGYARDLKAGFDVIYVHPSVEEIGVVSRFHREHPEIPMIVTTWGCDFLPKAAVYGFSGFSLDAEGLYLEGFVQDKSRVLFVRHLAEQARRRRSRIGK